MNKRLTKINTKLMKGYGAESAVLMAIFEMRQNIVGRNEFFDFSKNEIYQATQIPYIRQKELLNILCEDGQLEIIKLKSPARNNYRINKDIMKECDFLVNKK